MLEATPQTISTNHISPPLPLPPSLPTPSPCPGDCALYPFPRALLFIHIHSRRLRKHPVLSR